ncbi:TPA: ATP-binding cassette domain-containing protein [Candidatus Poribacteria bacterium]|nr:ATP-binding cassette domain-containing protein [Candidatus Poribacteria bacterium]HEX28587.1 ATP-binding cassette domain-containing protein [Candidatus Poribacteria bacterium]
MIDVRNLTKYYGNFVGIQNVSFHIDKGEVVGFLGPNGAGKTTTMRILTCFLPPTSGSASIAGYDVFKQSLEARRHIGYLPENVPLYLEMRVESYLRYMARLRGVPRRKAKERVEIVMEQCGLTHMRRRIIGHLSKGYRQRVGLAQALVHDPEVLILDEPTIGLDPKQIVEIRELIKDLGKEHTVILSTHILPEASMICKRVIIINEGRIAGNVWLGDGRVVSVQTGEGAARQVGDRKSIFIEARAPSDLLREKIESIPDVIEVQLQETPDGTVKLTVDHTPQADIREEISSLITSSGWGLLEMRPVEITLEEIFLRLVSRETELEVAA